MSLTTLFLDMNAYFASVEQQECPHLRHRAVVVVPVMTDATCCIAVSPEAKCFGIKTGTPVGQARRMCPGLRVIEARPEVYIRFHHAIVAAVDSCLPVHRVHSIDEMSCRLMGVEKERPQATAIAHRIKEAIRREVGDYLRCSIGLAPNRILAKLAADMQKPDGLTVITASELPERLYPLELSDLPGIGPQMERRFHRQGIRTVRQLCALSKMELQGIWRSVLGPYWWYWLRGYDLPDVPIHRRSVGHSHVLPPELRTRAAARAVLVRLLHRAAARLRNLRYGARQMRVWVGFRPQGYWESHAGVGLCQDTLTLVEFFSTLWERCPDGTPLRVGVILFDLVPDPSTTLPLFPWERARIDLARTMDALNRRYGTNTVYLGGMYGVRDRAPRRIAFTTIPRLDPTEA